MKKKHFKQKRFHPEGDATYRPVKLARAHFSVDGGLLEFVLYKKERGRGGCTYLRTSFSPSTKKEKRGVGAKDLIMYASFTSPGGVPRIVMFDLGIDGLVFFVFLPYNRTVGFLC